MGRRKGRSTRKNPNVKESARAEDESLVNAPHSFVISRGTKLGKFIQDLTIDFRKVMEPYTASDIKTRTKNVVKDFSHVAGLLKVSHLIMFTRTEKSPYLKIGRFPRGPTMTFRIREYTLSRDVRSSLRKQVTHDRQYTNHALLILNNFSGSSIPNAKPGENTLGSKEMELMTCMFQNMFPSINITTLKLNSVRRCVLLNYDSETGLVEFRHYTIKIVPVGVSRSVKKIVMNSKLPNLSRYNSVSDYFEGGGGAGSESEAEGDESSHVTLPQFISSRGNTAQQKSSIKLVELGPRLTLEPIKIEEGLLDARMNCQSEKDKRRKLQEENVKRFKSAPDSDPQSEEDNDAEWYEKEVGSAPEKDLFDPKSSSNKKRGMPMGLPARFNSGKTGFKPRDSSGKTSFKPRDSSGKPSFKPRDSSGRSNFKSKHTGKTNFKSKDSNKKGKRPKDVFNNQGVGPNFNKGKVNKGPRVTSVKGRKPKRKMYNIHILSVGYSKFEKDTCLANCTSTLIKSPDINIVVDTMTPWDKDKLVRELKTHRVEPDNVDYLICTHGHSDHVGNNNLFLKAKHIVGHCVHFKDVFETTPFFENNGEFKIDGDNLKVFGTPGHTMDSISVKVQTKEGVVVIAGDTFEKRG
ncbi:SSF1_2 [Lepeophtheirus salmonis]|uniref:SSF1_2 n=1 Tax=Lepeophtheirus salmonis TaxID=72036 RepID=A0A7R8HBR7_LEPSM|nr:SSF1_2 [Lepeophtheirus salmonis]CAF2986452.1 SSF1_2 [Lepeophtheirus salmonis]